MRRLLLLIMILVPLTSCVEDSQGPRVADLGPMSLNPQGSFPNALAQVLSNETGST